MKKSVEVNPTYNEIVAEIKNLCSTEKDFTEKTKDLIAFIGDINIEKEIYYLRNSGAIPESFEHDSSEEKLYAKFLDFLVFSFFKLIGMESILCKERGDYADVIGKTKHYIVVGDAKGFRLSRTALNPKDYKIEALNGWRRKVNGNYAVLVAPIHEFPKGKSRLYKEAITYNILMISYSHLIFILKHLDKNIDLEALFNVNSIFKNRPNIEAKEYWTEISKTMIKVCSGKSGLWDEMKQEAKRDTLFRIEEQIEHLNKIINSIEAMDEKKVKELLLDSWGIKNKLDYINRKKKILEGGLDIE